MSNSFYVTLPSHSSKSEFPSNTSNHFKIQLPNAIRLEGTGWKVSLAAISLPDTQVSLPPLVKADTQKPNPLLARTDWVRINSASSTTKGATNFDADELKKLMYNVNGIGFMKSMIAFFEHRIYNDHRPKQGATYLTSDGERTYIKFVWEGDDLVIDNREAVKRLSKLGDRPALGFSEELAKRMGWIVWDEGRRMYHLGPNIQHEFTQDTIPVLSLVTADVFHEGQPAFWTVTLGLMKLSNYCNWRILNINQAFQNVIGPPVHSLFVFSDMGGSSVVGNQITDLLQQVKFRLRGDGSQYFEPIHIQYTL